MRSNRSLLLACSAVLLAACGGGGGGEGSASLTIYGSATAPARSLAAISVGPTTAGSPTTLGQVFYAAWVSENADCSSPVKIADHGDQGREIDFFADPVLFEASPAEGTYPCLVIESSDTMTFTPDAVAEDAFGSVCTEGTEYTFDTFRTDDPARVTRDGSTQAGEGTTTAAVPQRVTLYITTDTAAVTAAHEHQKLQLVSPLVVPGQVTLYVDFSDQVSDNGGQCWLEQGVVGFY